MSAVRQCVPGIVPLSKLEEQNQSIGHLLINSAYAANNGTPQQMLHATLYGTNNLLKHEKLFIMGECILLRSNNE
jgi:hypothetical protein